MSFLTELFVFLIAALAVVPLMNRLGLSSVIGYLTAGVIIGPSGLRLVTDTDNILHFSEIGVVLLLFLIGLELQPRRLWVMRSVVFGLGAAQVAVTSGVLALFLVLIGQSLLAASVLGFALALSSTAFVLQLLAEKKQLNRAHGRAGFGILLFQDIAVIPVITVLSIQSGGQFNPWSLPAVIASLVVARYAIRPLLRYVAATGIHELFIAASLAIVTGAALGLHAAGLSMGLGAFIAGMLVADSEYRHQMETDVMPFKGLLLGLFFIAVGMSADLGLLWESPLLVLSLTIGLVVVKTLVLVPVAYLHGIREKNQWRTAVLLSQGGEFAFVLLASAVSAELIPVETMKLAILVVTLSMTTTPFLFLLLESLLAQGGKERPFDDVTQTQRQVIIAGFGRFGQIIGRILSIRGIPFTALEVNPSHVDFVRGFGNEIFYGDATRLDLLQNAGISDARAVIIALDNVEASVKLATVLRETYPDLDIFARARNRRHEIQLRELGVRGVIRETLLSSLELARGVLEALGQEPEEAHQMVEAFRRHDRETLQRQAAVIHDSKAFRQTTMESAEELKELFRSDRER